MLEDKIREALFFKVQSGKKAVWTEYFQNTVMCILTFSTICLDLIKSKISYQKLLNYSDFLFCNLLFGIHLVNFDIQYITSPTRLNIVKKTAMATMFDPMK